MFNTRGSFSGDLGILAESLVLMRLTKINWGRRVTPLLLLSNLGMWSGCQERASGDERSFPET